MVRVRVGKRLATCLKKYLTRPIRKFLNSIILIPPANWDVQACNLPTPFPIRIPLTFLLIGKWGKTLNHTRRRVLSERLTAFFKKIFKLKICFPVKRKGFKLRRPESPYDKLWFFHRKHWRRFNRFLYLNFRGCNKITYTFCKRISWYSNLRD